MLWWALLVLFPQAQVDEIPSVNPYTSAADIEQGRRLYNGRCAGCHGPSGDGGKGANLAVPQLSRAVDDRALFRIIRYGIPDTEMPGSLMDTHELWQTAAFVKTLGRVAATPVAGNPRTGEMLYRGKGGCVGCHAIGAEGGRMGPPLHDVGIRRSAAHLKAKLVDPASAIPDSYKLVTIKTRTGQAINGVWLNEDNWSIQLRDTADRFHSLWKKDLSDLKVERRTPMPSYKERLNASELDDIVAYLANQKGMPQ